MHAGEDVSVPRGETRCKYWTREWGQGNREAEGKSEKDEGDSTDEHGRECRSARSWESPRGSKEQRTKNLPFSPPFSLLPSHCPYHKTPIKWQGTILSVRASCIIIERAVGID
jgi:hypothetical protein